MILVESKGANFQTWFSFYIELQNIRDFVRTKNLEPPWIFRNRWLLCNVVISTQYIVSQTYNRRDGKKYLWSVVPCSIPQWLQGETSGCINEDGRIHARRWRIMTRLLERDKSVGFTCKSLPSRNFWAARVPAKSSVNNAREERRSIERTIARQHRRGEEGAT